MPRCPACGRRARGPHPPCAGLPPAAPAPDAAGTAGEADAAGEAAAPAPGIPGFRTEGVLGAGGFAVVLAASREADGARVALKVLRSAAGTPELAREAEALAAIGPPAVPALLGRGEADGLPFLALERLEGRSLADRLEDAAGPLPAADLARVARATLDALALVHAAGWAHGDLKPENVVLDAGGRARLLDLGLAERLGAAAAPRDAAGAGTPEYMSPEQCEGARPDARSDVYAAGALLLELAAGRPPFVGPPAEVRHAHLNLRPPAPASLGPVGPGLAALVLRCLAKDPADRPADAGALRAGLSAALASDAAGGAPASDGPRPAPAAIPPPARAAGEARRVGVVYLESGAGPVAVQGALAPLGASVAHAEAGRIALVVDPAAGENPVRVALAVARAAISRGLAPRALVDLASVTVLPRPGGGERHVSSAFARRASWPLPDDPPGALATAAAARVLDDVPLAPVPGREGILRCLAPTSADEATVVRSGAPPLLGRDEPLDRLAAVAREAFAGAPAVAVVAGEAGLGKTHLAAALAARLRRLPGEPEVLELRARPASEAGEGGTIRALLRAGLALPPASPAPADGGRAALLEALPPGHASLWPGAALALGWLSPEAPEVRALAAAPGALAAATVRAAGAILRARAARRPLCVLLDDAHLADGAALDALEHATLASAGGRIFCCALARPAFSEVRPFFGERAARVQPEPLGPLPPEVGVELCRRLLAPAEGIPARALARLAERARGVPLLLVELVGGLVRDGLLRRQLRGEALYLATDELDRAADLPLVEWLARRELAALPADLVPHAQLAALLGEEVPPAEVAGVLGELEAAGLGAAFPLDARAATRRLVGLGLLVVHRDGGVGFRLPLVRDAVAAAAPAPLRRAIHEAAHRFLSRGGAPADGVRRARLAAHAAGLGRLEEAGLLWLGLACDRRDRQAYVEAEGLYSRALAALPAEAAADRHAALRDRGVMRIRIGRYDEAVGDLREARALAGDDRAAALRCLLEEATALDWAFDYAGAGATLALAEGAAPALEGGADLAARLALARGRALFRAARWAEACAALREAARLGEGAGDAGHEPLVVALLLLGASLPFVGSAEEAEGALARAEALATSRGDLLHACVARLNRRNLRVARQDLEGAVRDQLEAARIAEELGLLSSEYAARFNLAELHYQAADLPAALAHLARAEAIEARHPELAPVPVASLLRARLRLWEGDLAGARAALDAFRAMLAGRGPGGAPAAPGPSEAVLAELADLSTRPATDLEWDALLARSARDSVEQEPIEVLELRGLHLLRAGDGARGRAALEAALDAAARIPNLLAPRVRRELDGSRARS